MICPCCNEERFATALVCSRCKNKIRVIGLAEMRGEEEVVTLCEECGDVGRSPILMRHQQLDSEARIANMNIE